MDKRRDTALQIQQCMQFDGGLGLAEVCPGEHGQAQVDGGGVEGVDGVVEFRPQVVPGIQGTGQADEGLGEVGIQTPVALPVGVGEGIAGDAAAQSQVVEFILVRPQADLDIAQAFAVGELGEGQAEELVETGKGLDVAVTVITPDTAAEAMHGQVGHELREDEIAGIHGAELPGCGWESQHCRQALSSSSR